MKKSCPIGTCSYPYAIGVVACALLLLPAPSAQAARIRYIPDPVYQSFDPEEASPMQDMLDLAGGGDIRAQYILGDLYAKGKGGLARNEKKGAQWFETAAKNGYFEAFIRLAALAKRHKDLVESYKWYTLAVHYMDRGPWRDHAVKERDALEKENALTEAQRDDARKAANLWRAETRRFLEEEKERRRRAVAEAAQDKPPEKSEKAKKVKKVEKAEPEKMGPPAPPEKKGADKEDKKPASPSPSARMNGDAAR